MLSSCDNIQNFFLSLPSFPIVIGPDMTIIWKSKINEFLLSALDYVILFSHIFIVLCEKAFCSFLPYFHCIWW